MEITIGYLYPDLCNLFGDKGNIMALKYRLMQRDVDVNIKNYDINDAIDFENIDILYLGASSDKDMEIVSDNLSDKKGSIKSYCENGGVMLAVCSGFEMLTNKIEKGGILLNGLGILDTVCRYKKKRHISNTILESDALSSGIVGFENHFGIIEQSCYKPLGKVVSGCGSCPEKKAEGILYKNIVATYLHGPLLPKNPHLTDYIIEKALTKKYGEVTLAPLDDELENRAHKYIVDMYSK